MINAANLEQGLSRSQKEMLRGLLKTDPNFYRRWAIGMGVTGGIYWFGAITCFFVFFDSGLAQHILPLTFPGLMMCTTAFQAYGTYRFVSLIQNIAANITSAPNTSSATITDSPQPQGIEAEIHASV